MDASFTPNEVADLYGWPAGDGRGQTIALIELGGGFADSDLTAYFGSLNLPTPSVRAVGVDGAGNVPGQDPRGADGEVLLDIEVAGAVAPGAQQVVYFAPNTDAGFLDAITTATHQTPAPAALSISWGLSEDQWTPQARNAMGQAFADAAALGISVTCAAGDNGFGDQDSSRNARGTTTHCDFPASSPHVIACGGTRLSVSAGAIIETVWNNATGGGISDVFPVPSWQAAALTQSGVTARSEVSAQSDMDAQAEVSAQSHVDARSEVSAQARRKRKPAPPPADPVASGRGVPDVAGNADPATGYQVLVDGTKTVIGGTSAVAPLYAGLVARLNQNSGGRVGLGTPAWYATAAAQRPAAGFRDIVDGDNGAYQAGPGWDACTGLGVADGTIKPA
ncbi:S53 family peptidase [Nigerium massiliense]|uniref:S53 family peptidase n=1 Tax=Nigerium massiliense TaxID=1522317 RepID=UPI000694DD3D|nr:S53 family peptidase [Nigerium massiliense]